MIDKGKGELCTQAMWPTQSKLIPTSLEWSDKEYHYSPLQLVHRKITPPSILQGLTDNSPVLIYTPVPSCI